PTVVSFGKFIADGQTNIIPDQVHLEGILRTFDETWRQEAQQKIRNIATGIAQSMGGDCSIRIDRGYPVVINDEKVTEQSRQFAKDFLGAEHVYELDYRMTAEDFAYYSQKVPSAFYRLGVRNEEKGIASSLHSNTFDIDEASLNTSIGTMSWIALNHLLSHAVEQ
ncbi:MAG: M20/M25/M40 family metallo-hydrolase, partial [Bacteroidota bacterium]